MEIVSSASESVNEKGEHYLKERGLILKFSCSTVDVAMPSTIVDGTMPSPTVDVAVRSPTNDVTMRSATNDVTMPSPTVDMAIPPATVNMGGTMNPRAIIIGDSNVRCAANDPTEFGVRPCDLIVALSAGKLQAWPYSITWVIQRGSWNKISTFALWEANLQSAVRQARGWQPENRSG
jgi:hypothetical protein